MARRRGDICGISRSPLWELHRPEDGGPKVVGVMIEYRKHETAYAYCLWTFCIAPSTHFALLWSLSTYDSQPARVSELGTCKLH